MAKTARHLHVNLDFRTPGPVAAAPGAYRFSLGHGTSGSPAVEVFIGATAVRASDGDSPRTIRPIHPGTWYSLRLTLDLKRRTYSGTIGAPGDLTSFSGRSFASGWDGTIDTILIDGRGPAAEIRPVLDVDNIAARDEPIRPLDSSIKATEPADARNPCPPSMNAEPTIWPMAWGRGRLVTRGSRSAANR